MRCGSPVQSYLRGRPSIFTEALFGLDSEPEALGNEPEPRIVDSPCPKYAQHKASETASRFMGSEKWACK